MIRFFASEEHKTGRPPQGTPEEGGLETTSHGTLDIERDK